jgi:SAM-dependent methyltransferase
MESYNIIANHYASDRGNSVIGLPEIANLLNMLTKGATILDFGCGTGKPITEYIAQHPYQFNVFAIDSSQEMVSIFRQNVPSVPVQHASILDFDFFSEQFDAIVSWGVMFHLLEAEQQRAIQQVAGALKKGGYFLFTSGKEAEMHHGTMYNVQFTYYSLGSENYRKAFSQQEMTIVSEFFGEGENYYYLTQKS